MYQLKQIKNILKASSFFYLLLILISSISRSARFLFILSIVFAMPAHSTNSNEQIEKSAIIREIISFGYLNNHFQQQIIRSAIECLDQDLDQPKLLEGQWSLELGKLQDITRNCARIVEYFFHTPIKSSFASMEELLLLRSPFRRRIDQPEVLYKRIFDADLTIADRGFHNGGSHNRDWKFGLINISPQRIEFSDRSKESALASLRAKMIAACLEYSNEDQTFDADYLSFNLEKSSGLQYYANHFLAGDQKKILYKCDDKGG